MSTHTPGPWHVSPYDDCAVRVGKQSMHIARAANPDIARLIAAAPDLLEACKLAALYLPDFCADGDQPDIQDAVDACEAAIARAKGKTT